nr:hypothetical protein [Kibdelosporangium sp. MJ126-NF4]CEL21059.1 hypothetical protein [Kibdelosporangium sp. MJ126-NF4]CTQ95427.1 hypothetical protein [Kibdelosporangium sp. MJ126-NF4]
MGQFRSIPASRFDGVAEAHQSCVACILRAARHGLFTEAEADLLIDRVRALSVELVNRP